MNASNEAVFGIFAFAVVDGAVIEPKAIQPFVSLSLIRADQRSGLDVGMDGPMQRPVVRRVDNHSPRLSSALTEAQNSNLAHATASGIQFLVRVLIGFLASNEAFIDFNHAAEPVILARLPGASLTETPKHEPCCFLGDADLFRHLHRTNPLPRCDNQVHRVNPFVERHMRPLENRCRANREIQLALVAAVEANPLASGDPLASDAGRAYRAIRPQQSLKVNPRGFLIRDECKQLKRADRRFAHVSIVDESPALCQGTNVYKSHINLPPL